MPTVVMHDRQRGERHNRDFFHSKTRIRTRVSHRSHGVDNEPTLHPVDSRTRSNRAHYALFLVLHLDSPILETYRRAEERRGGKKRYGNADIESLCSYKTSISCRQRPRIIFERTEYNGKDLILFRGIRNRFRNFVSTKCK